MPLQKKVLPPPSLSLVLSPASDSHYTHFEGAHEAPFEAAASTLSRVNAWWLADASLLTYWDEAEARARFRGVKTLW
jgi:triacylglycerol lipase